jgi:hypothetical protein
MRRECKPVTDHGTSPLNRFTVPPSRAAAETQWFKPDMT